MATMLFDGGVEKLVHLEREKKRKGSSSNNETISN
jgi:hypothetical protein